MYFKCIFKENAPCDSLVHNCEISEIYQLCTGASRGQFESDALIDRDNDARRFNMLAQLSSLKSFRFDRPLR